ncbi:MAG TPA: DUF4112 domain-containing protein [Acidobacteriaceae bacterium]|jgi:hypothetical protein|nr:DUF4112 domain-containing protein [Acidobacteriaceae bacterium]
MPPYEPQGIIEPPLRSSDRWGRGGKLLGDERLKWLEVLLDEAFVIPGTSIRFGIDGIVGLVPGLGDVLAGALSLIIPFAAWVRGVPYITVVRMLINVSIGLLIGAIPILGDAFDIFWKANRRNYRLLTRSIAEPRRHTWRDWVFLLMLGAGIALVFALPLIVLIFLLGRLLAWQPM